MVKQQQYKTARERTSMGSNYNVAVVPEIEDKHHDIKNMILFECKNKNSKIEITVNGSWIKQVKE